jgi:glycosyltransferase involved in cell wall biosynthesis
VRVWLLHIGEDLPLDGAARRFRYSHLAEALVQHGHEVLRWAPTFRHYGKTHRFNSDRRVEVSPGYQIQFVHSPGYRRNVSFERLRTYRTLEQRFRQLGARESMPDLIVAAIPSLEWASAAIEYGRANQVPVVIDVRDLWPDVFLNAFPRGTRGLGRMLLSRYDRIARRICNRATALNAVSPSYLDWALKKAGRQKRADDLVVPIGFEPEAVSTRELQTNLLVLRDRGVDLERPICAFIGLFERSYDLETVLDAARKLQRQNRPDIQFVLCGDGSKLPALRRQADGLRDIHFLGWVDAPMLQAVLSASSIGLCAYAADASQSLPNKPFEYMASGLAVVSSLRGDMAQLLGQHGCGVTYRAGEADSLANCLVDLLQDREKLGLMRANAYRAWSHNYRSTEIYGRFVAHLSSVSGVLAKAA